MVNDNIKRKGNLMSKQTNSPMCIVRIEKSGNRFNAWDTDGNKRTSEITSNCRKKAFEGNYLLGQFTGKTGKTYWRKVDGMDAVPTTPNIEEISSIEIPTDHAEILNFIHSSYSLKPQGLMMTELSSQTLQSSVLIMMFFYQVFRVLLLVILK